MRFTQETGNSAELGSAIKTLLDKEGIETRSIKRDFVPLPERSIRGGYKNTETKEYLLKEFSDLKVDSCFITRLEGLTFHQVKSLRQRYTNIRNLLRRSDGRDYIIAKFTDAELGECLGVWCRK